MGNAEYMGEKNRTSSTQHVSGYGAAADSGQTEQQL